VDVDDQGKVVIQASETRELLAQGAAE
jgi:hypothetical protein